MMDVRWNADGTISIDPPSRPKKLTGTRFASLLGLNLWSTPFQVWCEVTKACQVPFEDTVYTLAGKAIEPKQIQYMREAYGMDDLIDPVQEFGRDYFKKTWGNFFDHPVLGGMWDAVQKDDEGKITSVLEFKTTKRAEDWADDAPEYYALQAALYAYLLACDEVIMVVSFLAEDDYARPENYQPSAANTATVEFKMSERYPDFRTTHVQPALRWWARHVEAGVSPAYDEKRDRDYLKILRNASLNPESDVDALLDELAALTEECLAHDKAIAGKQRRLKTVKDQLRAYAMENIGDKDSATIENGRIVCTLTKTRGIKIDEDRLRQDGLLAEYSTDTESARFTVKLAK